jgi:hypothetical protein
MGKAHERQLGISRKKGGRKIKAASNKREGRSLVVERQSFVRWNIASIAGSLQWIPADPEQVY